MLDFEAKMYQIQFRLGLRPRPRWESLQRSPRPPSCILKGPTSKGRGGDAPQIIFLDTPLDMHCVIKLYKLLKQINVIYDFWFEFICYKM